MTLRGAIFVFPFVCCCPCDSRQVFVPLQPGMGGQPFPQQQPQMMMPQQHQQPQMGQHQHPQMGQPAQGYYATPPMQAPTQQYVQGAPPQYAQPQYAPQGGHPGASGSSYYPPVKN
jgi:hypothetical protein